MEICADVGQSEGPGPATSAELRLRVRETGAWAVRAGGGRTGLLPRCSVCGPFLRPLCKHRLCHRLNGKVSPKLALM